MNPTTDQWLTDDTQKALGHTLVRTDERSLLNFLSPGLSYHEQTNMAQKNAREIRLLNIHLELGERGNGQITGKRSTSPAAFQQPENYRNETLNACYGMIISNIARNYMSPFQVCIGGIQTKLSRLTKGKKSHRMSSK